MLSAGAAGAGNNNRPGRECGGKFGFVFFFLSTTSFIEYFHFVCKSSKKPNFLATSTGGRGGNPKSVLKRFQTKDSLEVENINDNGKREQR